MSDRERKALAVSLAVFPLGIALAIVCLLGVVLLGAGLLSWLHPVDVASAWARTLGGIGLIGGSAGLMALGWLAVDRVAARREETAVRRARKFIAVIGILLALICLPFAAAIHASAHRPWLGNRTLPSAVLTSSTGIEERS
ncbi:MAG: hypothetical protein ACREVO_18235 [Steroidobacteraceae bacterium]